MDRLTFDGLFCDIAQCSDTPRNPLRSKGEQHNTQTKGKNFVKNDVVNFALGSRTPL